MIPRPHRSTDDEANLSQGPNIALQQHPRDDFLDGVTIERLLFQLVWRWPLATHDWQALAGPSRFAAKIENVRSFFCTTIQYGEYGENVMSATG